VFSNFFSKLKRKVDPAWLSWPRKETTWNWWQFTSDRGLNDYARFAPVFACWRVISEEIARIPVYVADIQDNNVKIKNTTSAASRVLRNPNNYQTISDFLLYISQSLLADGNAYVYGPRNDRFERQAAYPINPKKVKPYISEVDGDIYYHIADSEVLSIGDIQEGFWVPARDMMHVRLFTYEHPLIGISPLTAASLGINAGLNINAQTAAFFGNMGRPSGIIKHPKKLDASYVTRIKEQFKAATTGPNVGDPIVFQDGMDWTPLTMTAVDAEIIASYKLTEKQVAQVYRVPPFFLGDLEVAKIASVEALMGYFINSGLGFYLTHFSNAFAKFFGLSTNQEIVFDYEEALLRGDLKGRMEAYKTGIQGGIFSVNEGRKVFQLPPVEYGNEVRMQQQMVPLSYGANVQPDSNPVNTLSDSLDISRELSKLQIKGQLRKRLNEKVA